MRADLIKQLRQPPIISAHDGVPWTPVSLMREAADEIERLRAALKALIDRGALRSVGKATRRLALDVMGTDEQSVKEGGNDLP